MSTSVSSPTKNSTRPEYPPGVPSKFSANGTVQRFPGNTTVCHIPPNSPLIKGLEALYEAFQTHKTLSQKVHLLPPASWHMTVFEGVTDHNRSPEKWPAGKTKQPLDECTQEFAAKLKALGPELERLGLAPPYRMRGQGFEDVHTGIAVKVGGDTPEEESRMRRLRNVLADCLGFRAPNHETYVFHVSVAYLLRHVDGEEREELDRVFARLRSGVEVSFELGPVEFNVFEDMHFFDRLFYLSG